MIVARVGKNEQRFEHKALEKAIFAFIEAKSAIESWNESVKDAKVLIEVEAKSLLVNSEAATISLFVEKEDGVKVSFGWDIKVGDDVKLKELLGESFNLLVKTETIYKPEAKLKELALQDDGLKACLIIKEKAAAVSVL